jgi:DNA-binding CsgD family transcriptional regulator
MLKENWSSDFVNSSFQRFILVFVTSIFSITSIAQQRTFATAKIQLRQQMEGSKEPTITALYFLRSAKKDLFVDHKEWKKTLIHIEATARKSRGNYYAQICTEIGEKLQSNGFTQEAYYFIYKAQKEIESNPPKDKRFLLKFHQTLGLSYFYFKRFDEARRQFELAYRTPNLSEHEKIGILNTLGLINRDQGFVDSSRLYFEQALKTANRIKHQPWIAVLSGNLGHYYWIKKEYKKARKLTELDYTVSLQTNQKGSAVNALTLLIQLDLKDNQLNPAQQKLSKLEKLLSDEYNIQQYRVYYRAKTAILEANGNYKEALESFRKGQLYNDTITKQTDIENIRKTEFQINFERKQAELSLLQERKKRDEIMLYGLSGITVVIILVFILVFNSISKRRKREREIALLKQHQFEKELENTEKEMRKMLSNLMEKNQLVEQLTSEIDQFQLTPEHPVSEEKIKMIDRLQSFTLLTDDDWLEFKKLFEKLNPDFFNKVAAHSLDLTNAEIRLITLIKLNLSNLEMSRALGISPDSVRKTSLRLRKKLHMELHEELVKFILSL